MNKLGSYIVKLLQVNPSVHLPGIGTFKKERIPAKFDRDTNSYLAPSQTIILLDEAGSSTSLIDIIGKEEGVDHEESKIRLQDAIEDIQQKIKERGESFLAGFGKLISNKGEGYTFIADEEKSFPLYKPVKEFNLISHSGKEEPELAMEEVKNPIETTPELKIESASNRWLWPVLLIAIFAIATSLWFLKPFKRTDLKSSFIVEDSSLTQMSSIQDSIPFIANATLSTDSVSSSTDSASSSMDTTTLLTRSPAVASNEPTYEIIIVSFEKRSEAEKYVTRMNAKGYKIRILETIKPGNLYKVSHSSYSTENEATQALARVRKEVAKDAWIYKNIHNNENI